MIGRRDVGAPRARLAERRSLGDATTTAPRRGVTASARPAVLAALLLAACGGDASTTSTGVREDRIVGGAPSTDPHVVALVRRRVLCEDGAPDVVCTGTLVAPRVVLTAAHCLGTFGAERLEVFFGDAVGGPGSYVTTDRAVKHPGFDPETHAHDVGLVRLVDDAPTAPLALATPPALAPGDPLHAVGYGKTEKGLPVGGRRVAAMKVDTVEALTFRATPDPGMSCSGDSGGPVFAVRPEGDVLVGLTVSGDAACEKYATNDRLDAELEGFVLPTLAMLAAPPGASSVPPTALCSAACGKDEDCPYALPCFEGRCRLPGAVDADLGAPCATSASCAVGESCRRVRSTGTDACLCARPCGGAPPEKPPPAAAVAPRTELEGGCAVSTGASGSGALFVVLALVSRARRTARGRRGVAGRA